MSPVIEVINVTREAAWLPWAVQYFFLIALSVGCFLLSLPGLLGTNPTWLRIARVALVGALVCGIAAPVALLADLHQPGRFWRFYAHPNLNSWMAWGAFFIPGYLLGLFLYAWAALRPALAEGAGRGVLLRGLWRLVAFPRLRLPTGALLRLAAFVTLGFALLVLLYTGMEVMVVRARPLWNTPFLPVQFALTGLVGATGLALVLERMLTGHQPAAASLMTRLLVVLVLATGLVGAAWLAAGLIPWNATHAAALQSVVGHEAWRLTAIWAGLAAAATIGLAMVPRAGWLAGLLALHACWMFRWTVFIGGQAVPKTGAGLYATHLPMGHDGLLGILGTGGLCLFLAIAITALLPWNQASAAPAARPAGDALPGRA
ncbi:polysulfide reductase NrfD [Roseococcus sp. SDR]|uniref:NrfD/PsrC family molybdoenzyme membrane anchor subunit n=1 Tax=Roseococcus sp. SDR TaxID=2835532 RepID=UPI001BCC9F4B|nr:NrfD/PsrC family molybdoenzyme membrane anchor subunit [Roseococcus sp. SDR]MBS7791463.1 polysulfide reductase NrfD [Roseococcus sp. SDR]MBV1846777.1 polysulfide reductase NrfD [Roseococcus sp. SDR]